MKAQEIDAYFAQMAHVESDYKEEWDAYRFMVAQKMFAMRTIIGTSGTAIVTLKLPPQEGAYYREQYEFITPGYYMNKVHWISVPYEQVEDALLKELMDKAYTCGIQALPKKVQKQLLGDH